ncbi:fructose-bisphosphate aldolase class I [Candidatus Woesearchaeota archaeon]|nr:fructose-bisphosphate aldolase class I [Candidatus Woesearchaeota archaeon]
MDAQALKQTIKEIATKGKGILAADESTPTMGKRLAGINVESTEEKRRDYRQALFTTSGCEEFISGVILFEETLKQKARDGTPLSGVLTKKGIVPGIKVDKGLVELEGTSEKVTQGLEGLGDRLDDYKQHGARFAKWRAVYSISDSTPSDAVIKENASRLAKYAKVCQEHDVAPIVEPEVLINGDHSIERCAEVTEAVLKEVFVALDKEGVLLEGMILKPSMVISGKENDSRAGVEEVAKQTLEIFKKTIPESVQTINFLSGGQTPEESTAHLQAMNKMDDAPWYLSFSYGRALQEPALKAWAGKAENEKACQDAFFKRAKLNGLATKGEYSTDME